VEQLEYVVGKDEQRPDVSGRLGFPHLFPGLLLFRLTDKLLSQGSVRVEPLQQFVLLYCWSLSLPIVPVLSERDAEQEEQELVECLDGRAMVQATPNRPPSVPLEGSRRPACRVALRPARRLRRPPRPRER